MTQAAWPRWLIAAVLVCLSARAAAAQSATCSYDEETATVRIDILGGGGQGFLEAEVTAPASGTIRLNGVACGAARVTNTDLIRIVGANRGEDVSLSGTFRPGLTPEATGLSEIEIEVDLLDGIDSLTLQGTGGIDAFYFTQDGTDVGDDGDQDITVARGVEVVRVLALGADDYVDGSPFAVIGASLELHGGTGADSLRGSGAWDTIHGEGGNDTITGGEGVNQLDGGPGNDVITGGSQNDTIDGGPGNDLLSGGGGKDTFLQGPVWDGDDDIDGGAGPDVISYNERTAGVTVTLGNGIADDGETGVERDSLVSVESARGGAGDDVLVGSAVSNLLHGNAGDDELYGEGGDDVLRGTDGDDLLVGDGGNDQITGGAGADVLDAGDGQDARWGGSGDDSLWGGGGNDTLNGDDGVDAFDAGDGDDLIYNADNLPETVNCGPGTDDPQASFNDTYVDCELI